MVGFGVVWLQLEHLIHALLCLPFRVGREASGERAGVRWSEAHEASSGERVVARLGRRHGAPLNRAGVRPPTR